MAWYQHRVFLFHYVSKISLLAANEDNVAVVSRGWEQNKTFLQAKERKRKRETPSYEQEKVKLSDVVKVNVNLTFN